MQRIAALDVGATKVAAGLVDTAGDIVLLRQIPTRATAHADDLYGEVLGLVRDVIAEAPEGIEGVGVGCAGPMELGRVSPMNIPAWRDFPLRDRLADDLDYDVVLDNDAKAIAVGEGLLGAARGVEDYLAVTVSSGVGGGIVLDGRLLDGRLGNAGHIGHMVVVPGGQPCSCGARGCVEAEGSGLAIARKAAGRCDVGYVGPGPLLETWNAAADTTRMTGGSLTNVQGLTAARVAELAGEPEGFWAAEIMIEAGRAVGRAIGNVATLLDLNLAVVGGGVAAAGDVLWDPLRAEAARTARISHSAGLEVVPAGIRTNPGIVGAAALVMSRGDVVG